ncbi:MAG: hypothetical protein HY360_15220 [Verrucomicrobia bacterium]|nr:hypothetical protein [Verrucomicrobiota bacterium]
MKRILYSSLLMTMITGVSVGSEPAHTNSYENEDDDDVKAIQGGNPGFTSSITGPIEKQAFGNEKVMINYKGISSEKAHSGKCSLKCDITRLDDSIVYVYLKHAFSPTVAIKEGNAVLSGYLYVEGSDSSAVKLAVLVNGIKETTGQPSGSAPLTPKRSIDENSGWHHYEINVNEEIARNAKYTDYKPGTATVVGWMVSITGARKGDGKLVVYIDDVTLQIDEKMPGNTEKRKTIP